MEGDQIIDLTRTDAFIFDMDGVITSSARAHASAWKKMFDAFLDDRMRRLGERHEPFDIETDYRLYVDGMPRYDGVKRFLESRGISLPYGAPEDMPEAETICGLGNRKNSFFREHLKKYGVTSFKSSLDFVVKLKSKGMRVAVISASRNAREVMAAAGIKDIFDKVVDGIDSAELGIKGKPAPDIFLEAAKRLDVAPDRAAVVEDALAGIEAGKAGGFSPVIGIDRDNLRQAMEERGATIVLKDLSELRIAEPGFEEARRPAALDKKHDIFQRLQEGRPIIFLDYDGTLTPIVEDPEQALLPEKTKRIIQRLSEYWTVVIMSGRGLLDVKGKVGLDTLVYAGSHGFNILGPGESFHDERGREFLPAIDHAGTALQKILEDLRGVRIEHKPYAIAIHYRTADERIVPELERRVREFAGGIPELRVTTGKKIFEIRPNVAWDKGKALLYLVETLNVDGSRVIPLYIGDDDTDEDAFEAIRECGIGILVSDTERKTAAQFVLRDPEETVVFLGELATIAEQAVSRGIWSMVYEGFDPDVEQLRESLCTTGNGYFAARGAAPEAVSGDVHYPGTYIAGVYNRLTSTVADLTIENESLVNAPNWLPLTFRIEEEDWFDLERVTILEYRQELDMRRGVLSRTVCFSDAMGRRTRLAQRRFVHMLHPHLAGLETTILPENWSGAIRIRSAIDGRVENTLVKRYRPLDNKHLAQLEKGIKGPDIIWLQVETNQSHIRIAEAARTRIFQNDSPFSGKRRSVKEPGFIGQEFDVNAVAGIPIRIDKIASVFTSRDWAISESLDAAIDAAIRAPAFTELLESHSLEWEHLWERWKISLEAESRRMSQTLNLHIFHLLQTVSPKTVDADVGVPPRGLHGEAYRGLIMWDELFIFPLLNLRMPDITRELLMYRYRRLPEARYEAKQAGYAGAMFPWQSGSSGREEAQTVHLNPRSGRWIPDNSKLAYHINVAVAYNVWQYFQVSGDLDFIGFYGAEMIFSLARFWASKAQYNRALDRYELQRVIGPDEFHDAYAGDPEPGINNNAYTNFMVAWLMCRALEVMEILHQDRRKAVQEDMGLSRGDLQNWEDISRKMRIVFHENGIISQFEGYDDLKEFDWDGYRKRYGDIHRLDRILESEGDTTNRYKVSKQADVLMLFYLLSAEEIAELFQRLGYPFDRDTIPKNVKYYLRRTSHGSTLSRIVHSWVLSRSERKASWSLFQDALESDVSDIQGGTTHEGIHLGAVAGTVDILQRSYTGLETRGGILRFNPFLPQGLDAVHFNIKYRRHWLDVKITRERLIISSRPDPVAPIRIGFRDEIVELKPGNTIDFATG